MKIYSIIIALMLGSLVFIGLFDIFLDISTHYPDDNISTNMSYFEVAGSDSSQTALRDLMDNMNKTKTNMDTVHQDFENVSLTDTDSLFSFYSIAFKMGKTIFYHMKSAQTILVGISQILGVPVQVTLALLSILMFIFIYTVVKFILGR